MADINVFAKLDEEYNSKSIFSVNLREAVYSQDTLSITADDVTVNFFVSRAQLNRVFGAINQYLEQNPCEKCANTGALPVAHGDTSFSGDEACPDCAVLV